MTAAVVTERRGRVLLITLNRPAVRNAINTELAQGLLAAVQQLDDDPRLAAGVLSGAGHGFCSGMDLKAYAVDGVPQGFERFVTNGSVKPLVAAIEGFALAGGLELALACDVLVASRGAALGIPEVKVGLFAAGGALVRLAGHLPYGAAMELALTGDPMTAERAHDYGLVTRLADRGQAVEVALGLAGRMAVNAPLAVAASKRILREARGRTEAECWALQAPLALDLLRSEDAREGPRAFVEKRSPSWTGR